MTKRRRKRIVMVEPLFILCNWGWDGNFDLVFKSSTSRTDTTVKLENINYAEFSKMLSMQHWSASRMANDAENRAKLLRGSMRSCCDG